MKLFELIYMAMRTVVNNPMRTLLTMLGVIIGVSSVVTLVAIGQGTSASIEKQYEALGTNLIVVNLMGNGRATQLVYNDLMELEKLPEIQSIAPTIVKSSSNIKYDRTQEKYTVVGTNENYLTLMKGEIGSGRFISSADLEFRNQIVVLGTNVAKKYFGTLDPIGEDVNIDGVVFTVVGVLKEKGSNISGGVSLDDTAFVPLVTAQRAFKLGNIRTTYLEAPTKDQLTDAQNTITQYLTYKFKSTTGYQVQNQDELMKARVAASSSLNNQLISVACISLLVGGIGIMNIMLVTVSERTREIGIRKSIGAKRRNILMQFLIEATVISGLGGIIGLLLGSGLALAWPLFNPKQATVLSFDVGLYSFLFSVGVGMIFGLYPANKASKLRPIDALRTD
ncbi:ABC transporter permease [Paenibacillus rigui]|uniref:Macrolide ABC transporter ATP-binding protein n=1 Tax=Paenibacillus rigui TaxID=554312 RepID=A0A229ULQ7_9BACL|nr:ABC transporter permease [Paenibacillus rigui]OXM84225.1 macrolide ABC transporter ATP-binding protein [Paenibacillus rigui]